MAPPKLTPEQARESLVRRFHAGVDRRGPDECWPWKGTIGQGGYGLLKTVQRKNIRVSRLALELDGRPPGKLWALHSCDNPPCCNPAHLFLGTSQDNVTDAVTKGRMVKPTCRRGHPRTPENLYLWTGPKGYPFRICIPCRRITESDRKARKAS
jgi:hypothetical protein